MKTAKALEVDYCLVNPKPLTFLHYQTVYQYVNGKKILKAINILKDGRLIKKYRLEIIVTFDEQLNESSIITKLLMGDQTIEPKTEIKKNNKRSNGTKINVDRNARSKAASNLFTSLGL